MKYGAIILACLVAAASAVIHDKDVYNYDVPMTVDQTFINLILRHNWQPLIVKEYMQFTEKPVLDETMYLDVSIYKDEIYRFFDLYQHGLVLPRGRIGTFFDEKFLEQTGYLFKLFYYSKDMDTLFHNMIWARENVNEYMFIHALHLTIFHRSDLTEIVLPPLYEILPNHFFTNDVIQKGIDYKMAGLDKLNSTFTMYADYTSRYYLDRFDEQYLSYFTEDIGLNSFYYYFNMRFPMFLGSEVSDKVFGFDKEPVGELWFYMHQQLLARYYLERISNDMGSIYDLIWVKGIKNGYWPMLRYKNGVEFSYRSDFFGVKSMDTELLELVDDWELRIRQMIDSGFVTLGDKKYSIYDAEFIDVLGHLVVGNIDETRFYRYVLFFYHMLAGGRGTVMTDSYWMVPSVLENFETMLRDPVFYQLYAKILNYYYQYKELLPTYTVKDLFVPVTIQDVVVSPLKTYFEYDQIDATNIVDMDIVEPNFDFNFLIRQPRLNYEQFDVKLLLNAETAGDYTIRFFLGPKVLNRYQLDDVKQYFFELDHFITKLTAGKNTIMRNSREFLYFFRDLIKYVESGDVKYIEEYGFPAGLLLPKGKVGGMPFTFFVIVHKNDGKQRLGFPFDRKIDVLDFFVPNMFFKDVIISQIVNYDLFADSPLNNFYYNDVIPMNSIRVPLNVDYYTDNKLDYVYLHTSDVYNIWYKMYKNFGTKHGKTINVKYDLEDGQMKKTFDVKTYGYDTMKHTNKYNKFNTKKYDDKIDFPYMNLMTKKYDTKKYDTKMHDTKKYDTKMYDTKHFDTKYDDEIAYKKDKYLNRFGGDYKKDKYMNRFGGDMTKDTKYYNRFGDDTMDYDKKYNRFGDDTYGHKYNRFEDDTYSYGKKYNRFDDDVLDTKYDTVYTPKYVKDVKDRSYTGRFPVIERIFGTIRY